MYKKKRQHSPGALILSNRWIPLRGTFEFEDIPRHSESKTDRQGVKTVSQERQYEGLIKNTCKTYQSPLQPKLHPSATLRAKSQIQEKSKVSEGKKANKRQIRIKTLPQLQEKLTELTGGTYFEQPVHPPQGHLLVMVTFLDILKTKKIDRQSRQHRNEIKLYTYLFLNVHGSLSGLLQFYRAT